MNGYFSADGVTVLETAGEKSSDIIVYLGELAVISKSGIVDSSILSHEEQDRARRLRNPEQARWFVCSRWMLRQVLLQHSSMKEGDLQILSTEKGKPFVNELPLSFNTSRSGKYFVIGLSEKGEIGIDIEHNPTAETCREVSAFAFTESEQEYLSSSTPEEMVERFSRIWTLKEAILKASGEGLSRNLQEIKIRVKGGSLEIEQLPSSYESIQNWQAGHVETKTGGLYCAYAIWFR